MIHPFLPHGLVLLAGSATILAAVMTWSRSPWLIGHVTAGLVLIVFAVCWAAHTAITMAGVQL